MPGDAPRPPSRAAGGRGGRPSGAGRTGRCMPCVVENGLLPGRGPAPGRGAGRLGAGRGAVGASGGSRVSPLAAAGTGVTVRGACGSLGAAAGGGSVTGVATAVGGGAGSGTASAGAGGAGGADGADAAASARNSSPNCSCSRRTTGASTVEDADLTNSPMSFRVASTVLLSTPSSLASSWTRTLATSLLLGPSRRRRRPFSRRACSCGGTHRVLMSVCSASWSSAGRSDPPSGHQQPGSATRGGGPAGRRRPAGPPRAEPDRTPDGAPQGPGS